MPPQSTLKPSKTQVATYLPASKLAAMPPAAEASIFIDATVAQCVGAGRRLTRSVPSREFTRRIIGSNLRFKKPFFFDLC